MKKILYVHGFASDGNSFKSKILKEYFGNDNVISPTLPVSPKESIELLSNIIKDNNYNILPIGTSLGGFYVWFLCNFFEIKGICINPLESIKAIERRIGINKYLNKDEYFEFTKDHVNELYYLQNNTTEINYSLILLLLSINDEIIDYNKTLDSKSYKYSRCLTYEDNHRFENFKEILNLVEELL